MGPKKKKKKLEKKNSNAHTNKYITIVRRQQLYKCIGSEKRTRDEDQLKRVQRTFYYGRSGLIIHVHEPRRIQWKCTYYMCVCTRFYIINISPAPMRRRLFVFRQSRRVPIYARPITVVQALFRYTYYIHSIPRDYYVSSAQPKKTRVIIIIIRSSNNRRRTSRF